MSLLAPLGLALLVLVVLPIVAHSLRSGPKAEVILPTARFTPHRLATTQKRNYLEDRGLLVLRGLLVALLALLAASPLAKCSTLSLSRPTGGSVALALILDDSASMLVEDKGVSRFERARSAAKDLLSTARDGDSFAVILAGTPARTLVPRTTSVDDVLEALDNLKATERATDLGSAVNMARASLEKTPQPEKQIAVLSDGAGVEELPTLPEGIVLNFPLAELSAPFENCAIIRARRDDASFIVETECTSSFAADDRKVSLFQEGARRQTALSSVPLSEDGLVRVALPNKTTKEPAPSSNGVGWVVEISRSEHDALPLDDRLELPEERDERIIAVYADRASAGVETSDRTVVELALESLDLNEPVRPLRSLPEKVEELRDVAVLVVDNPAGFRPETQNALESFVTQGGVLLTLLGPLVDSAPLSAGFWPITKTSPRFATLSKDASSLRVPEDSLLTELARGYETLKPRRRVTLEPEPPHQTLLEFSDGTPLLLERNIGLGTSLTSTLSASVEHSDFALRPGFLAILERAVEVSRGQDSTGAAVPGATWKVPDGATLQRGPKGASLEATRTATFTPEFAGVYVLSSGKLETTRHVARHPLEHTQKPSPPPNSKGSTPSAESSEKIPISREVALTLLALSALELWFRRRRSNRGGSPAIGAAS
jgi:von Willebrand factor type A domain/Aerotolerance regulator N-terminal